MLTSLVNNVLFPQNYDYKENTDTLCNVLFVLCPAEFIQRITCFVALWGQYVDAKIQEK